MSVDLTLPEPAPLPTDGVPGDGPLPAVQPNCFGSGLDNPAGMHMVHHRDGDVVRSTVTLDERFEGARGLGHGGIVTTLLDDVMGGVLVVLRERAVTAQLNMTFVAPVVIGHELRLEAWLAERDGRKLHMVGRVLDGETEVAIARALFLTVGTEHFVRAGSPPRELPHVGV
jgi:acyl-coenzyme A thioesterase PaaI-like protein